MELLGRYKILEKIGSGTMGVVFKGKDIVIDRIVAIKTITINSEILSDEEKELVAGLYQEARVAGKLSNPNITAVHDVGFEKSIWFIVMEYIEGKTLEYTLANENSLSLTDKINILSQLAATLHYAHQNNVIHRDIKPANIMILEHNKIKIMDFGIGKITTQENLNKTKHNGLIGTPTYMSPEHINGEDIDRQSDIFSLGVVAYELLTGKLPFKGKNFTSLIYQILSTEPSLPSKANPEIPESLDTVIMKAVEKDKTRRYGSASDFADNLEIFLTNVDLKKTIQPSTKKKLNSPLIIQSLKKKYNFFSDFSDLELQKIFELSCVIKHAKGEIIFEEGDMGKRMYIIISGVIEIYKIINSNEKMVLNSLTDGDCFGEMAIIGSTFRSASAEAKSDCRLLAISEVILRNSEPGLCLKLYRNLSWIISERLIKSDKRTNLLIEEMKKNKQTKNVTT